MLAWLLACTAGTASPGAVCSLDPLPEEPVATIELGPGGVLWAVDQGGVLLRYERKAGRGCAFVGGPLLGHEDPLDAVQDVSVDAAGRAWALVFYDRLQAFTPNGDPDVLCDEDFDQTGGHTVVADPSGGLVYAWPIGADDFFRATPHATTCDNDDSLTPSEVSLDTVAAMDGEGRLVVAAFDPASEVPPGAILDPADGTLLAWIEGSDLAYITALGVTSGGLVLAGGVDGDLWWADSDGLVASSESAETWVGAGLGVVDVAVDPDGGADLLVGSSASSWALVEGELDR